MEQNFALNISNINNAWEKFEVTGKIDDYLNYTRTKYELNGSENNSFAGGIYPNGNKNDRDSFKTEEYGRES